ncbi:MAG TPA: EAL domain-containing protein [Nitrospiraceae bacterium]|nr:EAL domain-containing protein [Nitrospiraceae bacterium]
MLDQKENPPELDAATGLPTKAIFFDRLTQALTLAKRKQRSLAVMFISFDSLKLINDNLGQRFGDQLLKTVSERLVSCLRVSDTVARPGSNEFMVLLPEIDTSNNVPIVVDKIFRALGSSFVLEQHEIFVNASIGISMFPDDGDNASSLLKNSYAAMQQAHEEGKNTYRFYSQAINDAAFEKMLLENNLRLALQRGEFVLHYQPQIDLRTGQISGTEALVRWQRPDAGLVYPAGFIRLMEDNGLIVPLGEWVLRQACLQGRAWQNAGIRPIRMAVNLSARQFQQQNIVEMVEQALEESGLEPALLELELTESIFIRNIEPVIGTLRTLRSMGVHVSIDDFGTGYSSLSYLKYFPVNKLKIVEPFVSFVAINTPNDVVIANAIVAMAHSLNMKVIAEGVEHQDNLNFLRSIQCDELQGNVFCHPLPVDELTVLLREGKQLPPENN